MSRSNTQNCRAAPTIGALLDQATRTLTKCGIESARLDARVILAHCLGADPGRVAVARDERVERDARRAFADALARRAAREPVAQIVGEKEFWSLSFKVTKNVLTPRPDSEILVDAAWRHLSGRASARILDLGTGSGCLLISTLLQLPDSSGVGIDVSIQAIAVARENAQIHGLEDRACFCVGDWAAPIVGRFDLIVSNPPYIDTASIEGLEPEVTVHEPRRALEGGSDGLDAYRALLPQIGDLLRQGGLIMLETGAGQATAVAALAAKQGLETIAIDRDLSGIERCVILANEQQ